MTLKRPLLGSKVTDGATVLGFVSEENDHLGSENSHIWTNISSFASSLLKESTTLVACRCPVQRGRDISNSSLSLASLGET